MKPVRPLSREFDSYPPEFEHLQRLLASFDILILDLDSDPDTAVRARGTRRAQPTLRRSWSTRRILIRNWRSASCAQGPVNTCFCPLSKARWLRLSCGATTAPARETARPRAKTRGKLLVFAGSKGGSGVTTVACNVAIALAQNADQKTLLIDLALPIGDAALCLGIAAGYSTDDALRNIDRLDASLLQNLLVKHRSGVFVLAAPTKVPEVEVSKSAIEKLIEIARREFDHVIVDVGSRIDVAAKVLFEDASTIYLVTQTGISELRNSNRLISQFFAEGSPNLEIVINRFDSRFHETVNEDVVAKALGRPVRWKIPNDQDAARALQCGDTGALRNAHLAHQPGNGKLNYRTPGTARRPNGNLSQRPRQEASLMWISDIRTADVSPVSLSSGRCAHDPGYHMAGARTDRLWRTSSPSPNSMPRHRLREPLFTHPGPAMCCRWERIRFGSHSLRQTLSGYAPHAGRHFHRRDQGNAGPLLAHACRRSSTAARWTMLSSMLRRAIPGKFEYSPAAGEVLPPGTHTLSVTFTPTDSANYATAQATVSLTVARAASDIEWPTPDPITLWHTAQRHATLCHGAGSGNIRIQPRLGSGACGWRT